MNHKFPKKSVTQTTDIIKLFANKLKKDGEDHFRISPFAATRLGKALSPDWRKIFFMHHVGEFLSPQCFANWLSTGNDDARHDIHIRPTFFVRDYSGFVLYGKYFQLLSMRSLLEDEMKDIPLSMYRVHTSGVREYHRWKEYSNEVKDMINHILAHPKDSVPEYNWEERFPGLLAAIDEKIKLIANLNQ
jgi:hypothetical protein